MNILRFGIAALLSLVTISSATAGHHPIETAADNYREAVKDFERIVFRSKDLGRIERTVADSLEDQTSRVRSEARDLDNLAKLGIELDAAADLHVQVERTILSNPNRPSLGVLIPAWQQVEFAYSEVASQFETLQYGKPYATGFRGGVSVNQFRAVPSVRSQFQTNIDFPIIQSNRLPETRIYRSVPAYVPVTPIYGAEIVPDCPRANFPRSSFQSSNFQSSFNRAPVYSRAPIGRFGTGAYLQR